MANNGFLSGTQCIDTESYVNSVCTANRPTYTASMAIFRTSASDQTACSVSGAWYYYPFPAYDCQLAGPPGPSQIPSVQDGISLGWMAGIPLILVASVLFLKRAFK